jgi:hypothetical protein
VEYVKNQDEALTPMELTYPIYVLERDDFSFREFTCTDDLDFCERDDVLDGLYEGWDSQGCHIAIHWDENRDLPTALVEQENAAGKFAIAIERYADLCDKQGVKFDTRKKASKTKLCDPSYLRARLGQILQR